MRKRWVPEEIQVAPRLDREWRPDAVRKHHALLINPFYAKDVHASFGKQMSPADLLIKHRLTHAVWRPLVEQTRKRHLRFRQRLARRDTIDSDKKTRCVSVVSAGV